MVYCISSTNNTINVPRSKWVKFFLWQFLFDICLETLEWFNEASVLSVVHMLSYSNSLSLLEPMEQTLKIKPHA